MIRVILADDHRIVREGLRRILADAGDVQIVAEAADAAGLLEAVASARPHVILMDVAMPGPGPNELLKSLRTTAPDVKVLVLSMYPEDLYAVRLIRAGAVGYLTKDQPPENVLEAVRRVYAGRRYVTPSLAEELASAVQSKRPEGASLEGLSAREFEVLRLLASGRSAKRVAAELKLSPKTVNTYRTRILEKLHLHNTAELIRYALEHGLAS